MGTGTGTSTWNLNGGTLAAVEIASGGTGTSTLNLNGGTLLANANNASFLHGLSAANVLSNGAVIDSGSSVISIAQALLDGGGGGGLTKLGMGTLYLNGANTYTGLTTVSNGILGGTGSIAGSLTVVSGATLAPGASIGTLTVGGAVNLNAGSTNVMELNKTTATNDQLVVSGGLTYGGTLVLKNLGGQLAVNDTFTLFPNPGAGSFTVQSITLGQNVTWDTSQLAVNGTVRVASATSVPVAITPTFNGSNLTLAWPSDQTGWTLQMQTNSAAVGISTNWVPVAGSSTTNQVTVPINPAIDTTFFRLVF
jgi:autotransporter-associated beta strand protein